MNDRKIFFFDLDGTLLTSEKIISEKTRIALLEFVLEGNHVAICTGRGLDNVMDVSRKLQIDFPGSYLIGFNGGIIYECDTQKVISRIGKSYPGNIRTGLGTRHTLSHICIRSYGQSG